MNIPTMTMATKEARTRYLEYRRAVLKDPNPTDEALMHGYKTLAKGRQVIDLVDVMQTAGVDEQDRPRLAIVRADAQQVYCHRQSEGVCWFLIKQWFDTPNYASRLFVRLPDRTFRYKASEVWRLRDLQAIVPLIPPRHRPRFALSNYHILFEADWQDAPRDPILLRRVGGMLFAVLATWELTDLERAVLRRR